MGEEAIVGKQAHVVEEVRLHKDDTQEQQQVTGSVRKERVVVDEMDETGNLTATGQHKPKRR
jgi:stress response protein YsnF